MSKERKESWSEQEIEQLIAYRKALYSIDLIASLTRRKYRNVKAKIGELVASGTLTHFTPGERAKSAAISRYEAPTQEVSNGVHKRVSRAEIDSRRREFMRSLEENPPIDTSDKEIIRRLEAEVARLTAQLTWAQHAESPNRTGGLLTLRASDHHYGDSQHLLSCGKSLEEKFLVLLQQYEPERIQIIAGDDWIAGRGIYREQDLDMATSDVNEQIQLGAVKAYEFLERIRNITSVPVVWNTLRGNHDHSNGTSMAEALFLAMKNLCNSYPDVKFVMHWDSVTANLADVGIYNVLVKHGFGYCKTNPSSPAFIDAIKDEIIGKQRKMLPQEQYRRILSGHCFDDQTEILTPDGWMTHDKLNNGSTVMSLNRDTGKLEWNKVQAVFRYDHFKELIHVSGSGLDLAVTGGHGLYLSKLNDNTWFNTTADESFGKARRFMLAAEHDETELELSDAQIKVLAWIIAEGELCCRHEPGKVTGIRVAQSDAPDHRLSELENDLLAAGLSYTKTKRYQAATTGHGTYRNFDAYRLYIKKSRHHWQSWISTYISGDKSIRAALSNMSLRQMKLFLDTYVKADGTKYSVKGDRTQIASNRKDHIDWLQQLVARCGYRSNVSIGKLVKNKAGTGYRKQMYYLSYCSKSTVEIAAKKWTKQPYDGVVWCVTVPNGTLLVRRNGKTCVTLNTHFSNIGTEHIVGLPFDNTGGLQRNVRIRLGANQRPTGWIVYVSTKGMDSEILSPIGLTPDTLTFEREMADPHLSSANRSDAAKCVKKYHELLKARGDVGAMENFGVVNSGRW